MKIDRLIGILTILLQQEKVTAPVLAEKFEVSRRTINRDIEDLCKAGIPIVTEQGREGGISIMDNYKIDKTLLTVSDMREIFTGLGSLDSISGNKRYRQLMEKLSAVSPERISPDVFSGRNGRESALLQGNPSMLIDLSSWSKEHIAGKIGLIQSAMEEGFLITFSYFSPKGESIRLVEPYYLIFKWSSWYVYGWCRKREDFRLFKLNRMDELQKTDILFEKRKAEIPDLSNERVFPHEYQVQALFTPDCRWRLIEEFGKGSFVEQEDGRLLFSFGFTDRENLFSWILTFGGRAELLEPKELRKTLLEIGKEIQRKYEK